MYRSVRIFVLVVISLLAIGFLKETLSKPNNQLAPRIMITNGIRGNLIPCNCGGITSGGLPRLATLIDNFRESNSLVLDFGNFCGDQQPIRSASIDGIVEYFNYVGYDAIGLGSRELKLPPDVLLEILRSIQGDVVCTNLNQSSIDTDKIRSHVILNGTSDRIAILALIVDDKLVSDGTLMDPEESLSNELEILSDMADYVICCITVGKDQQIIAGDLSMLSDFRVDGIRRQIKIPVESSRWVTLAFNQPGGRTVNMNQLDVSSNQIHSELKIVDKDLESDPHIADVVSYARLESAQQLQEYALLPPSDDLEQYRGNAVCYGCHHLAGTSWTQTQHARAYNTICRLIIEGTLIPQSENPECLACHTTAYELNLGRRRPLLTSDVGCEECHGPGAQHVALMEGVGLELFLGGNPDQIVDNKIVRMPQEDTCLKCHTEFRDPQFNYEQDIMKVMHNDN